MATNKHIMDQLCETRNRLTEQYKDSMRNLREAREVVSREEQRIPEYERAITGLRQLIEELDDA